MAFPDFKKNYCGKCLYKAESNNQLLCALKRFLFCHAHSAIYYRPKENALFAENADEMKAIINECEIKRYPDGEFESYDVPDDVIAERFRVQTGANYYT